jgi:hypothetical protein
LRSARSAATSALVAAISALMPSTLDCSCACRFAQRLAISSFAPAAFASSWALRCAASACSFAVRACTSLRASISGGVIAFYQMGYRRAALCRFGVGPVEAVVKKITALRTSVGLQ